MTPQLEQEIKAVEARIERTLRIANALKTELRIMKRLARKDEWTLNEELTYDAALRRARKVE